MDKNTSSVTVTIPVSFLLTLAVYGNMGDGDIPGIMRAWAVKECERVGLDDQLAKLREERYQELKQRVTNIYGLLS